MQASQSRPGRGGPSIPRDTMARAVRYLWNYRKEAPLPYFFLIIATIAQLAVPRLVSDILNAVISGVRAPAMLDALNKIPENFMAQALPKMLESLKFPLDWTQAQLAAQLTADKANASTLLIQAGVTIVVFAIVRGLFAFLQAYWAERNSQAVAFDMRNDLYAKIQRLSFSYHDQNQTGQLMIRATDDVEKVRLFIGQGLLQLVGAIILLVATLIIMFITNAGLALASIWILPVALVLFMFFGGISQPLFAKVQQKLSAQ